MLKEFKDLVLAKLFRFLSIPLFLLLVSISCSGPKTTQITNGSDERLSRGNWTLDEISIGDRYGDVVEAAGGHGEEMPESSDVAPVFKFYGRTIVHFTSAMKVIRVLGRDIKRDSNFVVSTGQTTTAAVKRILGKGKMLEEYDLVRRNILDEKLVFKYAEYQYHDGKDNRFKLYFDRYRTLEKIELTVWDEE